METQSEGLARPAGTEAYPGLVHGCDKAGTDDFGGSGEGPSVGPDATLWELRVSSLGDAESLSEIQRERDFR